MERENYLRDYTMLLKTCTTERLLCGSLFALAVGLWSIPCSAATIVGPTVTLSSLLAPGGQIVVADKTFTSFTYSPTGEMPAATLVNVIGIQDDFGNYGIRFQGGFTDLASSPGASDALITYMVTAGPGFLISGAHLMGNPNVMGDVGAINVTETFLPLGPGGEYTMEIFDDENVNMAQLMDETFFVPPVQSLNVQKNILGIAVEGGQSVTLSMVDQTFSQINVVIPEPISAVLLVSAFFAVGLIGLRRSIGLRREIPASRAVLFHDRLASGGLGNSRGPAAQT